MSKALVVLINLLLMQFAIGEDVYFSPEEIECIKELNLNKQQILDHVDLNTFEISENIPHIEDFGVCLLKKLKFDISSENPDGTYLEKFLEDVFHAFEFKIENKLEFANNIIKKCHSPQKTDKDSIKFINCMLKYSIEHL